MDITITSPRHLQDLINLVHDLWFDVDQIEFDREQKILSFQIQIKGGGEICRRLRIRHVLDVKVNDTEKVGQYDINEVRFDAATKTITITGGVPIEIKVFVDAFELQIDDK